MRQFPQHRLFISIAALVFAAACTDTAGGPTGVAMSPPMAASVSSANVSIDPALLTPNPVENSAEGTVWECRKTGDAAQCTGHFVQIEDGANLEESNGFQCSGNPIYIAHGVFTRDQVRYFDTNLLEYRREAHIVANESWNLSLDGSGPAVIVTEQILQFIRFSVPGDLDSRSPADNGVNFLARAADGRVLVQDAGRATAPDTGDLDTFHGRWDSVRFGDDLTPICAVLTGQ